jgi:hypothetical protein
VNPIARLWRFLTQCVCAHPRARVTEVHYKGYGVADLICPDCGHKSVWEFTYEESADKKQSADD